MSHVPSPETVLRLSAVCTKLKICRSSVYEKISPSSPRYDPTFPKPFKLGATASTKAVGFLESAIDSWLMARVEAGK